MSFLRAKVVHNKGRCSVLRSRAMKIALLVIAMQLVALPYNFTRSWEWHPHYNKHFAFVWAHFVKEFEFPARQLSYYTDYVSFERSRSWSEMVSKVPLWLLVTFSFWFVVLWTLSIGFIAVRHRLRKGCPCPPQKMNPRVREGKMSRKTMDDHGTEDE
jgi:hypothetical protein